MVICADEADESQVVADAEKRRDVPPSDTHPRDDPRLAVDYGKISLDEHVITDLAMWSCVLS